MALKFFGPNRMAAQQDPVDAGSSLVRRKPSWGMGPQGMPGAFDYDSKPHKSAFFHDADKPNAYERGGFYWTGRSVAQGTPVAHQDQRRDLAEQNNARAWAEQAIRDKRLGLNVKDVNARIRQADRRSNLDEQRFGLDERRMGMLGDQQAFDRDMRRKGLSLDEVREQRAAEAQQFDRDMRRKGLSLTESNADREYKLNALNTLSGIENRNRQNDLAELQIGRKRDMAERDRRQRGLASSSPERFYSLFERLTGESAYEEMLPMAGSKPVVSQNAQRYINRVDALAVDPRLKNLNESQIASLAAMETAWQGDVLMAFDPEINNWRKVNYTGQAAGGRRLPSTNPGG